MPNYGNAAKNIAETAVITKLRQVEVLTAQGRPVAEAIRAIGVTEVTYYRWRSEGRSSEAAEGVGGGEYAPSACGLGSDT